MIPVLALPPPASELLYDRAIAALARRGFAGELTREADDRIVLATDNSIYQVVPEGVAYPRNLADLVLIARLLAEPGFHRLVVQPRGGGTGTNGQSLGRGLTVDLSRHFNRIVDIDAQGGTVTVEAGVVKDQLNAALEPHGLFFAPELSTSNRATIGGMISTDASGQGSCLYGKTRDHVLSLTVVMAGGEVWTTEPLDDGRLSEICQRQGAVGRVHRAVDQIQRDHRDEITARFPNLNRCLTGYDLAHIRDARGRFDLASVLCGSEGTLAFVAEARLRVLPIPKTSAIVNVRYATFDDALRDAQALGALGAASIETIDSKVLALARGDSVWAGVAPFFPDEATPSLGINFVEFVGEESEVERRIAAATARLAQNGHRGFTVARGGETKQIWAMRKRAVGLLGNVQGGRRPVPFVEDAVVPPERLRDFIAEFRACLDGHGLEYGMFGHVDAGVLHVRPALDLKQEEQEPLIREITTEVVALTKKYGGLLWGEHGKGFRSEFVPEVFGDLAPCLSQVKAAFDPRDQFNPGKIASAAGAALTRIDEVDLRGRNDRRIPLAVRTAHEGALSCNGNGACFNFDVDDAMCPSWKATGDRRHSPKGRAALMREWLKRLAGEGWDPVQEALRLGDRPVLSALEGVLTRHRRRAATDDFSHLVKEAMDGCLGCKACAGTCPIKVDVPNLRARFLELYHTRYRRPLRDYLVGALEPFVSLTAVAPRLSASLMTNAVATRLMERVGLIDIPALAPVRVRQALRRTGIPLADPGELGALDDEGRRRSVVLVQDAFTSFFETELLLDVAKLLRRMGFRVFVAPFRPNGKPLHVLGMGRRFRRVAARNARLLNSLAATGVPLVGIDPSMTLTYRGEYREALGALAPTVLLLQEWLASRLAEPVAAPNPEADTLVLLPHCTERALAQGVVSQWPAVAAHFGLKMSVAAVGCCGMAGMYGHQREHRDRSQKLFSMSWAKALDRSEGASVATGYSCRCQAKRFNRSPLLHPAQAILRHLEKQGMV